MTNLDPELITQLVVKAIMKLEQAPAGERDCSCLTIPIGISNRHIHLTEEDYHQLFGDLPLVKIRDLTQPGEFASNRTLEIEGPKRSIKGVRVLGPLRTISQVELAKTDARVLGLDVPVRVSGNIMDSPPITLVGPAGQLDLRQGAIVAQRHIHMSPADAERFQVKDGDLLDIRVEGERPTIFCDTLVRVKDNFVLEMHLDSDEANAIGGREPLVGRVVGR